MPHSSQGSPANSGCSASWGLRGRPEASLGLFSIFLQWTQHSLQLTPQIMLPGRALSCMVLPSLNSHTHSSPPLCPRPQALPTCIPVCTFPAPHPCRALGPSALPDTKHWAPTCIPALSHWLGGSGLYSHPLPPPTSLCPPGPRRRTHLRQPGAQSVGK